MSLALFGIPRRHLANNWNTLTEEITRDPCFSSRGKLAPFMAQARRSRSGQGAADGSGRMVEAFKRFDAGERVVELDA